MMECAFTPVLGASHFDRISAHHHISERDKIRNTLQFGFDEVIRLHTETHSSHLLISCCVTYLYTAVALVTEIEELPRKKIATILYIVLALARC